MSARPRVRRQFAHPGWRRVGRSLVRELAFRDFDEAIAFVDRLATAAADYLRRPDICVLDFNRVRLTVANPNHSGLTQAEFRLVAKVNEIIDEQAVSSARLPSDGDATSRRPARHDRP